MNKYFGMIGNKLSETLPDSDRPPISTVQACNVSLHSR